MDPDPPSLKRPGDATLSPGPDVKRSKPDDSIDPEPVGDLPPDAAQGQKGKGRQGDKVKRDEKRAINAGGKHRGRRGTRQEGAAEEDDGQPKAPRLPKRQCALLIGFSGTGYAGMQIQPTVRTIEGTLFKALVEAGAISQDNADDPVKSNLNRAARTDAGVHAAGNVVSIKMITSIPGVTDIVARINELLPPEIRLWNFIRVQNSFNARTSCDSRKYTYFFPSYMLIPPKPGSGLYDALNHHSTSVSPVTLSGFPSESEPHPFWASVDPEVTPDNDLRRKRQWRVKPEQMETLRSAALKYEKSHNFHNFTVGREFSDRSVQRFMKQIEVADPAVYGETEWIAVMFHGQSFMLHQRKMMCALVMSCRTQTPPQIIDELFGPRTVLVPKMPALGLLLEYPIFESYNRRVDGANANLTVDSPEYRAPLDFEAHRPAIDAFKQTYIYENMRAIEDQTGLFDAWVRHIDAYAGNDLLYLNLKGNIPAQAVIKLKERRDNPFKEKRRFDLTSFTGARMEAKAGAEVGDDDDDESDEEVGSMDKKKLADMEG